MYKYYCFNAIAECGLANLSEDFVPVSDAKDADGILVRSAALHELEFGKNLKVIARAGAGVNNIPLDRCAEEGIVVFNTPGANANGVKNWLLQACSWHPEIFWVVLTGYRKMKKTVILPKMPKKQRKLLRAVNWKERSSA